MHMRLMSFETELPKRFRVSKPTVIYELLYQFCSLNFFEVMIYTQEKLKNVVKGKYGSDEDWTGGCAREKELRRLTR